MNPFAALGRYAIRAIDWIIRFAYQVKPYSEDPDCILRISPSQSKRQIHLSDGVQVQVGDPILALHFWNERLERLPQDRTSLGWRCFFLQRCKISFHMLAAYLDQHPQIGDRLALRGEFGFVTDLRPAETFYNQLGFDVFLKERPGGRFWRRAFWDNVFSYALLWAFRPRSLQGKHLTKLIRVEIWISRGQFMQLYGEGHTQ